MRMREFDDILNECLERVLRGDTVEDCLKNFPEHAAELEPLLRTASDTHKAANISPRPEFRQRAAYEFQTAIREMKPARGGLLLWQMRWITAVSVLAVVLLAGSGTVMAASDSLPDQSLYGVKLFTEQVRVALTPSDLGKAQLYAEYTDTRVGEIIKMADKGNVEQVEKTTERMNESLSAVARLIQPERVADTLSASEGPPALMAVPSSSPELSESAPQGPAAAVKATPAPEMPTTLPAAANMTSPARGSENIENDDKGEKSELKDTVSKQAEKNTKDLEETLKRAPESVRPALEKAIQDAQKGYEKALDNPGRKNK